MTGPVDRLPGKLSIEIPTDWTPDQAFAVFELIDGLRDAVWRCYSMQLLDEYRERLQHQIADHDDTDPDDPSF